MSGMSDDDFMLHILGNLPKEYEAVLIDLENILMADSSEKFTIELMCQKLNDCKIKKKLKKKRKHWL